MTLFENFDSFYEATAQQTLLVMYALCGERQLALQSTVDAYRHAARDWKKVKATDPQAFVRSEAWHLTTLNRTTHPLRRGNEEDSDTALLRALHELDVDSRHLLVLLTLGNTDLDQAASEVQVTPEEGIELTTEALAKLEQTLGEPIEGVERRLNALGDVTGSLVVPPVAEVRKKAKTHRLRNTVVLIAAGTLAVLGLGVFVTEGSAFEQAAEIPQRQKFGSEASDQVLVAAAFDEDQLLSTSQLQEMDPTVTWTQTATEVDLHGDMPYATCPTKRFANPDPLRTFVRTYDGEGSERNRLAQAVEISRTTEEASAAYTTMVSWFAECQHPRTQLIDAYEVDRPTGNFKILRLQSNRDEVRTFTVGLSRSGTFSLALVHETDGKEGPDIEAFARTLNESVYQLCRRSGGQCSTLFEVKKAVPPETQEAPGFLGIVDLPSVAQIDSVWAATDPDSPKNNPAATLCEGAQFGDADKKESRIFLIPEADELPKRFGLAQTVATFKTEEAAKKFLQAVERRMSDCSEDNKAIAIDKKKPLGLGANTGFALQLNFEVEKDRNARLRTGFVQRGRAVSQVTFTPVGDYDIDQAEFKRLVERAGQRLEYVR